jgi:hypothetical protein
VMHALFSLSHSDRTPPDLTAATCTHAHRAHTDPITTIFDTNHPTLQGTALKTGHSTWNVDVTVGRPGPDGSKVYVMAAEQQPRPGAPPGSGWTTCVSCVHLLSADREGGDGDGDGDSGGGGGGGGPQKQI